MDHRKALSLMLTSRYAEEGIEELASKDLVWGTYHLSIGQEACHAGLSSALEKGDWVVPTHRCHGYNVALGTPLDMMFSEMLGSRYGICGGIGGGARQALAAAGIKLYPGVSGNADKAAEAFAAGTLAYDENAVCHHHDHEEGHTCSHTGGHGCGHHSC